MTAINVLELRHSKEPTSDHIFGGSMTATISPIDALPLPLSPNLAPSPSYPISEIFESVQGEGQFVCVAMTWLRLGGCSVGRPIPQAEKDEFNATAQPFQIIKPYQEKCCDWGGYGFVCDTDYRVKYRQSVEFILKDERIVRAKRVCISGGEPLIHNLEPLITALLDAGKKVHIETSGTKPLQSLVDLRNTWVGWKQVIKPRSLGISAAWSRGWTFVDPSDYVWLTVSPKKNYLPESLDLADEIKVLIDTSFDEQQFLDHFGKYLDSEKLWIQPVNDENTIRMDNLKFCLDLQQRYRGLRLSMQAHKIWNVR
jgi:organic radical activating enzyme